MRCDQFVHQRDDAGDERGLGHRPIGKGRIVGDVNEIGAGPRRRDLAINRQAAEPGVKHQNRFGCRHQTNHDTANRQPAMRGWRT